MGQSFESKLAESGLTLQDAHSLGMEFVVDASLVNPAFNSVPAIKINYYDCAGKPLPDRPMSKPYYRLRYLSTPPSAPQTIEKKQPKYIQEAKTLPVAYFPRLQNWGNIINNTTIPIIITEGELKAAKACREGFPTIGLGGVHSWRSLGKGLLFIDSLAQVNWVNRIVYICFDSDFKLNPSIQSAIHSLAEELQDQGSDVRLVVLPQLSGLFKTGLDDFLVSTEQDSQGMLLQILKEAQPLGIYRALFGLNDRYVCVDYPICVFDKYMFREIPPDKFKTFIESDCKFPELRITKSGELRFRVVSAADTWLSWQLRNRVGQLVYSPGQKQLVTKQIMGYDVASFNMWRGWACEPREGDVSLFLTLINFLFSDSEPAAREWFLDWLAYPLQYPGTKLYTAAVLHSIKQGTGKSLVGYTMKRVYGTNFRELKQDDLKNTWTEWAINKQFIMGDDVTGSNKREFADKLKSLITQEEVTINKKYISIYEVDDCINYLFTSNQPDAFFLEDTDRRFFIHECPTTRLPDDFYTTHYHNWLRTPQCGEAVFHYLLHRDLSNFKPNATAYVTPAKQRMIAVGRSDLATWVREVMEDSASMLKMGNISYTADLITSADLLNFYDPTNKHRTTAGGVGRVLSQAGCRLVCGGARMYTKHGRKKLYILRNYEKWSTATHDEVVAYYNANSFDDDSSKF